MWLIPLTIALLLVPALFGFWAWAEVIERIREDHAAIGRRTRALRFALVAATAGYLVGVGTSLHPATFDLIFTASLAERFSVYLLIALPWIAFGTIGLLARSGRRTGLTGFLMERDRQERRLGAAHEQALFFLQTIGLELEGAAREIQDQVDAIQRRDPTAGAAPPDGPDGLAGAMAGLRGLAETLRVPMPSEPREVMLDPYLAEGLAGLRWLAEERGVSVYRSGLEDCLVCAAPQHLRQILQVVLEGAMERAPRNDGLVVITIQRPPGAGSVELAVCDNGKTLNGADLAGAFALDPDGTRPEPVTGLGFSLAMARRVARQDGGEIEIRPAASGGTVVSLSLMQGPERTSSDRGETVHAT